jgi:hypothetical protein
MGMKRGTTRWPKRLYLAPDEWCLAADVYAMDECELCRTVSHLRTLGDNWRKVSKKDAAPIYLVAAHDDDAAIYKRGTALYLVRRDSPGWYRWEPYEGA